MSSLQWDKYIFYPHWIQEILQSSQTSAEAMHLLLTRLVSMSIILYLLPSSNIDILVFYLFSIGVFGEQHVWELWIQFSVLTLFLGTPLNNPRVPWLHFAADSICIVLQISTNSFVWKPEHANLVDAEPKRDFNAKWPFKVIRGHLFWCQWRATKGLYSNIIIVALNVKVRKI